MSSLPKRVTIIEIDGNSIGALAMAQDGDKLVVEASHHVELDKLVEVVEKMRHPVFMDLPKSNFPDVQLLASRLKDIFSQEVYRNPVVAVLGGEKFHRAMEIGEESDLGRDKRRKKLLNSNLPINPLVYPCVIAFREENAGPGKSMTVLLKIRLMDLFPIGVLLEKYAPRYLGAVTAQTATANLLQVLSEQDDSGKPTSLCNVGKMRTLYSTWDAQGRFTHDEIPVGLARDDMHYFRSISPVTAQLNRMKIALGSLFFPPEVTPSPLFTGWASSPQIDCTRFAIQVSHYAERSFGMDPRRDIDSVEEGRNFYLTGRASRIVGLRQFLENKIGVTLRRIDRRPIKGVELANDVKWADLADNVIPFGAGLQVLKPRRQSIGLITHKFLPPPMKDGYCTVGEMADGALYVFEQRVEADGLKSV